MPELSEKPTLSELQLYIKTIGEQRGWNKNNVLEIFLLFSEEVGELAKAIRNRQGLYAENVKKINPHELELEFADVLNYLLDLANCTGIDLETAFRLKDKINNSRHWNEKQHNDNK
jgi:NTP pyrophosphatase (non-canonical NTP hydrolase)